jgi:hypothetical protein
MATVHAHDFLTPSIAARLVGLTPSGLNSAAARGRLPIAIRTSDGRRLYLRGDVLKFKAEREAAETSAGRAQE